MPFRFIIHGYTKYMSQVRVNHMHIVMMCEKTTQDRLKYGYIYK